MFATFRWKLIANPKYRFKHLHAVECLPGGTVLKISMAAMRHPEVHGVRPEWWIVQGRGDSGIVQKGLLLHHGELIVTADSQVRRPDAYHAVVRQIGELLGDDPHAGHLLCPVIDGGVGPEALVVIVPCPKVVM